MRLKTWLMSGEALFGSSLMGAQQLPVTFDGNDFVRKVSQMQVAYGRPPLTDPLRVTEKLRKELLDKAGEVCRGSAYFYGTEPVPIGECGIDWFGGQKRHQEWVAQLNRFTMLEPLGAAYRLSSDDAYAARAAAVMADWCDFWDRHERQFIDPQNNNVLNVSIRIRAWLTALAIFMETPPFTPALVERLVGVLARQSEMLTDQTRPGDSNWQIAQAHALLEAGLALDFMPGAERWRMAGVEVLNACFVRQFRADGSHVENTTGYHNWMVDVMIYAWQLSRLYPELGLQVDPEMIRKGLSFRQLGAPFAFNDSKYADSFPRWPKLCLAPLAIRGGIADWQPPLSGVFLDAGLVFGGNATEKFFFDAGQFGGWHTHLSRLTVEYGAYGHNLLVDPAITSYERSDDHFAFGRTTRSHATVHFNGAHQLRAGAELLDAVLNERFAVAA
ncbi:MAG: heparinase II/III family protein, partial [Lentisphaeria bacterium]